MNNSEILFLYDAKLCNPNGDPDEENRPRMDYERERNLVSDLRLKRYLRDYLELKGHKIYVTTIDGKAVTAEVRMNEFGEKVSPDIILENLIDVRLFGATVPIKKATHTFTGPIQFNWGYSLNNTELLEASITSHFSSKEDKGQGTFGKDYRVYYSFIAFSGVVSGKRAIYTRLSEKDMDIFDEAMVKSIPLLATRSKIGQYPRLYMRVEYVDDMTIIGDMRPYIKLMNTNGSEDTRSIREINECAIEISKLLELLKLNTDVVARIHYYVDEQLVILRGDKKVSFTEAFSDIDDKLVRIR